MLKYYTSLLQSRSTRVSAGCLHRGSLLRCVKPRDADRYSSKLLEYHQFLWNKQLPNGKMFKLAKIEQNRLYHKSEPGEFYLSSDRAIATFSKWKRLSRIISEIPAHKVNDFVNITKTIGAIMIWPANRIDQKTTINGERGFNRFKCDRLDLTIECIRRYYLGIDSPLSLVFEMYSAFFKLFENFKGYVDFFLLQDAVNGDCSTVRISTPFDDFKLSPIPKTVGENTEYMECSIEFVKARNMRIKQFSLITNTVHTFP